MNSDVKKNTHQFLKVPDGTLIRYGYFPPTTRSNIKPSILLLQGRASYIERFSHIIRRLNAMGHEVWAFDWRGQGLSTRQAGKKGYIKSYTEYLLDLDLFIKTFFNNEQLERPFLFFGQSMGAHLALRYMAENPGVAKGAVLAAPMLDINTGVWGKRGAYVFSKVLSRTGFGKSYVLGHRSYNPLTEAFEGNLLTRCPEMFYRDRTHMLLNQEFLHGGVTYGWVSATLESISKLKNPSLLGKINEPIQMYIAGDDRIVDNRILDHYLSYLPKVKSKIFPGARHQILSELQDVRDEIYKNFSQYVDLNFAGAFTKKEYINVKRLEREAPQLMPELAGIYNRSVRS